MLKLFSKKTLKTEDRFHSIVNAKQHHQRRIDSILEEIEVITQNLKILHLESDEPPSNIKKQSDVWISRMVHLQYEVQIREDCLKWLT